MNFTPRRKLNNLGFTMIEVIVIIAILAVATAIVIASVGSVMNRNAEHDERARSMYYSMQSLMSNIKLSSALPKNDDGSLKLYKNGGGDIFTATGKNYYFHFSVEVGQIKDFRFMVCTPGGINSALAHDDTGHDYGDYPGTYYAQYDEKGNSENDKVWTTFLGRVGPFAADFDLNGYFLVMIDEKYRVSKVYFSPVPFDGIMGEQFSGDGYIEGVGLVGAFPLSASKDGTVLTGAL